MRMEKSRVQRLTGSCRTATGISVVLAVALAVVLFYSPLNVSDLLSWHGDGGTCSYMDVEDYDHVSRSRSGILKKYNGSDMTLVLFTQLVSQGKPFVVRNAFDEWPAMQRIQNCSSLSRLYPNMLYHDWQSGKRERLSTVLDWDCRSGYLESNGDNENDWASNVKPFEDWLTGFHVPQFMPADAFSVMPNADNTSTIPLMSVFIGMPSTGVAPHVDETCESFVSIQFSGRKLWTVSWPELGEDSRQLKWSVPLSVVLEPGDTLFWFMSQVHHTEVLDGCSVSSSLRFTTPGPNVFHRQLTEMYTAASSDWRDLYRQVHADNVNYFSACSVEQRPDSLWTVRHQ